MRKLWINLLAAAVLLTAAAVGSSQAPRPMSGPTGPRPVGPMGPGGPMGPPAPPMEKEAPAKSKLEEMLEIALKNNPDLKVAKANAFLADAEVNRTRLAVTQKVIVLYQSIEAARATVKTAQQQLARLELLQRNSALPQETVDETAAKLTQAKAELAKLEAEVPYLLGEPKTRTVGDGTVDVPDRAALDAAIRIAQAELTKTEANVQRWQAEAGRLRQLHEKGVVDKQTLDEVQNQLRAAEADLDAAKARYDLARANAAPKIDAAPVNGPLSEAIRAALNKPVTFEFTPSKEPSSDNLERFLKLVLKNNGDLLINNKVLDKPSVNGCKFEEVPVGAVLQWLEDDLGTARFVVRDYGLLLMPRDKIPPDAVLLNDFWKAKPKTGPKPKE